MFTPVGQSVESRDIEAWLRPSPGKPVTVVFGGFHGDEPKSVHLANRFIEFLDEHDDEACETTWVIIPLVNPDGGKRRTRRNAHRVDINRNFPTHNFEVGNPRSRMFGGFQPASEPETRMVMHVLDVFHPSQIITIHSIAKKRHCNNYDGPGKNLARAMGRRNRYPVTASIGYPTPGSFGTYAGIEHGIPTVTLELPSHHSPQRCWNDNRDALLSCGLVMRQKARTLR